MAGQPTSKPICPSCGADLPPDAPRGLCLKCLFALGTKSEIRGPRSEVRDQKTENASPEDSDFRPPTSDLGSLTSGPGPRTSDLGPRPFGDYELVEEIARGGMGVVYKARQKSLGRMVAVKMLLFGDQSSKEQAQRFRAEAAAAASLQHPNIVAIHEVGAYEGQPFFAMDFVEGQSLAQLNAEREVRNMEWLRRAAGYVKTVAEAIHYAHEHGILHRDLKPSNVLIDLLDQPRVTDFGLAKRLHHDSELTLSGQVLGSPNYMPPEQAAAKRGLVGRRSDVYSLGAILYHLLTGRPPCVGETLTDTLQEVMNKEPVSPCLLNPSVPPDLETLCLKCLEKEPSRRYPTAWALAEDLDRFLRDEPVQARPVGHVEKIWRWCRRKPALAGLVLSFLLALAVGLGGILWGWRSAERGELNARLKAYGSDMNIVQQALTQNNLGRAQYLLNRQRPQPGQRDLRGWEWRYLWQQCRSDALFTLCTKSSAIRSLALSADGNWLAAGEHSEGRVSIWDLHKREEIVRFPADDGPAFVVFSPRERLLAFASGFASPSSNQRHRLWLWDGETKRIVAELLLEGACRGLAFSGDGHTLATIGTGLEGNLTLWKVPEGIKLARYPAGRISFGQGSPFAVAPDMSVAAYTLRTDNWTAGIRVMDLQTGKERWTAESSDNLVTAMAISPDGKTLASGTGFAPSPLRVWELTTGKEIYVSETYRGYVCSLAFSPDGKTLAAGNSDQTIRLWDTDGWRPLRTLLGHKGEVGSVALLPDNKTLVSGSKDRLVLVWDTAAGRNTSFQVRLPANYIAWSFGTNSQTVLTCDRQGRVAQWQGSYLVEERLFEIGTNVVQAFFLPRRSIVLARLLAGNIQVWDLQTRSFSREFTLPINPTSSCFCKAEENRVIIGDQMGQTLYELDLTTWQQVRTWQGPAQFFVAALSSDGRRCVTLGDAGASMITDLTTGRTTVGNLEINGATFAAFSTDGKRLAASSHSGFARIWDAATLQPMADLRGFLQGVASVAFSPDGQRLVTGSDGTEAIKFWEMESYEEVLTLEGEGSLFRPSAFSSDGTVLGSITDKGVLHLWRAPSWGEIDAAENSRPMPHL